MGKYSLHEETNRNGKILCAFAFANNITISTWFQHKQIQQPGHLRIKLPKTKSIMLIKKK